MGIFLVTSCWATATRVIKPPEYSNFIFTCGVGRNFDGGITIVAGRRPKKLTTTSKAETLSQGWDDDRTMCASDKGYAILTTKTDNRRSSRRYKEAAGYLVFDSDSIRGTVDVCTLEGHEVKLFTAESRDGDTVITDRAIFYFYHDGDTLCVNHRESYFVYTRGKIEQMPESDYEARFPEDDQHGNWIDVT